MELGENYVICVEFKSGTQRYWSGKVNKDLPMFGFCTEIFGAQSYNRVDHAFKMAHKIAESGYDLLRLDRVVVYEVYREFVFDYSEKRYGTLIEELYTQNEVEYIDG